MWCVVIPDENSGRTLPFFISLVFRKQLFYHQIDDSPPTMSVCPLALGSVLAIVPFLLWQTWLFAPHVFGVIKPAFEEL